MIEMRELRKGNMVKCLSHLPIGYHVSSFPYTEIYEIKDNSVETEAGTHKYKDIAPIPLTEEILVKAGGLKLRENEYLFRDGDSDPIPISLLMESGMFYLGNNESKQSVRISSVHHFQNLYYVLKGKEVFIDIKIM